jgi:serine/threonine protein kinase
LEAGAHPGRLLARAPGHYTDRSNTVIGKLLDGKYRLVRVLGAGGMGSVYEAEEQGTGRTVAIKLIHANLTAHAQGDAFLSRFDREARAAGAIDTEHIVRIFDVGSEPDTLNPYMVMEYLVGEDLDQLLRRLGPLPADLAVRIVAQACIGLQKAHDASVVHRDVKPANLYLAARSVHDGASADVSRPTPRAPTRAGDERIVKILDFGIAKVRREYGDSVEAKGLTRTGSMLGSPLYMSPEQARSVKNVDHRSDLWSLGVVLYQLLAGRTPCQHLEGLGELILSLCNTPPTPVQEHAPWVPPEVARFLERALRIDPGERFQTAGEMLAALHELAPSGIDIRESMLVAIDPGERARVAPPFRLHDPAATTGDSAPISGDPAVSTRTPAPISGDPTSSPRNPAPIKADPAFAETAHATSAELAERVASTSTAATFERARSGVTPGRRTPLVAAGAAAALLVGAAAYALSQGTPPAVPAPENRAAPAAPSLAPAASEMPVGPTAPSASAVPAAPSVEPAPVASATPTAPAASTASARPAVPVAKAPVPERKAPPPPSAAPTAAPKEPPRLDHSTFGDRK